MHDGEVETCGYVIARCNIENEVNSRCTWNVWSGKSEMRAIFFEGKAMYVISNFTGGVRAVQVNESREVDGGDLLKDAIFGDGWIVGGNGELSAIKRRVVVALMHAKKKRQIGSSHSTLICFHKC